MAGNEAPPADHRESERYGPLVHRSVHHGAILLILGPVEFIVGMAITQLGWTVPYSLSTNVISDLGAVNCGDFPSDTAHYVCSPWHVVFNISIILLGVLLILAVILIRTAFPARRSRTIGLGILALSGAGAIGVGLSPEDVNIMAHVASAGIAFAGAGIGLIVLGFAMFRDTRWDGFRAYTILSGLVDLVALSLFEAKTYFILGMGGMERLIVAPILLWAVVVGIHLYRIPTFAPRSLGKPSAA